MNSTKGIDTTGWVDKGTTDCCERDSFVTGTGGGLKHVVRAIGLACVLGAVAFVLGCAATQAKNPQQAVLAVRVGYTDAVEAASTYGNPAFIPLCSPSAPEVKVCAKPAIVQQIKLAKDVAKPVIDNADATVLDPSFSQSEMQAVVVSAQNALKALTAITQALNLKAPPKPAP